MPANRIELRFQATGDAMQGAFLPYFTSGFPDAETAARLIHTADAVGAAVVEIGMP